MFSFGTPLKPMFNVLILTACATGVLVPAVQAQEVPPAALRYGGAPPAAEEGVTSLAIAPPPATQDECPSGDVCYSLAIDYAEGRLRNPAFAEESPQGFDDVRLRAYVGKVVDAEGNVVDQPNKFVAPAVEISPGDTFRLMLHNRLPKPEDMVLPGLDDNGNPLTCDTSGEVDHNEPHCSHFNLTNMHTHGLWVSPAANSDNVLLTVHPNVRFTYEYNIPNDHPSGTFWYHAHRHGSTAVQVSSGMAGVLLIRGDRQPVAGANGWARHGDLDVILPRKSDDYAGSPSFRERVMLFQQIAYGCRDDAGALKTNDDGTWRCDEGDVGTLEPGPGNAFEQIGFGSWPGSGRHTAINGEVRKSFDGAVAGEVERWRLIHGGVRETIRLTIRKAADASSDGGDAMTDYLAGGMTRAEEAAQLDTLCDGDPVPVVGVATDGLTRPDIRTSEQVWLQPAYREDILVTFPEPGRYCIIDAAVSGAENINTNPSQRSLLGLVTVGAGSGISTEGPVAHILDQLAASVEANIDTPARAKVLEDLENGRLDAFVKHRPIPAEDVTGRQTVGFNISFGAAGLQFQIGEIADNFQVPGFGFQLVNPQSYNPMRLDRELPLGGTEEWFLTSFGGGGHPFHIHVNPFKIIDIRKTQPDAAHPDIDASDPSSWVDVSAPGPDNPSQYAGLKDVWKDTIFTLPGHLIRFRTRYERYIGDFVLHCHILDHEDEGMMQNVRISIPDGRGGFDVPMTEHVMGDN